MKNLIMPLFQLFQLPAPVATVATVVTAVPDTQVSSLDAATTNLADPIKERTRTEGGKNNWKKHDIELFGEFPLNSLNEEDEDIILNIQK